MNIMANSSDGGGQGGQPGGGQGQAGHVLSLPNSLKIKEYCPQLFAV